MTNKTSTYKWLYSNLGRFEGHLILRNFAALAIVKTFSGATTADINHYVKPAVEKIPILLYYMWEQTTLTTKNQTKHVVTILLFSYHRIVDVKTAYDKVYY